MALSHSEPRQAIDFAAKCVEDKEQKGRKILQLSNAGLGDEDLDDIGVFLETHPDVTGLNLSNNPKLSPLALLTWLEGRKGLTSLNISNNRFDPDDLSIICQCLGARVPELTHLYMSNMGLQPEHVALFEDNYRLIEIDLSHNNSLTPVSKSRFQGVVQDNKAWQSDAAAQYLGELCKRLDHSVYPDVQSLIIAYVGLDYLDSFFDGRFFDLNGQVVLELWLDTYEKGDMEKQVFSRVFEKINPFIVLIVAVANEKEKSVRYLIEDHKFNPDHVDKNGVSPLYWAALKGSVASVKLLIEAKANINQAVRGGSSPFAIAARVEHADIAKELKKAGADVDYPNHDGDSPVHFAVKNDDVRMLKILIENKADISKYDLDGHSPIYLSIASPKGSMSIVEMLLAHGAGTTEDLASALAIAQQRGYTNIAKLIEDAMQGERPVLEAKSSPFTPRVAVHSFLASSASSASSISSPSSSTSSSQASVPVSAPAGGQARMQNSHS